MKSVFLLFCLIAPARVYGIDVDPVGIPKASLTCLSDHTEAKRRCGTQVSKSQAEGNCSYDSSLTGSRLKASFNQYLDCVEKNANKLIADCISKFDAVGLSCNQTYEETQVLLEKIPMEEIGVLLLPRLDQERQQAILEFKKKALAKEQGNSLKSLEDVTERTDQLHRSEKKIKEEIAKLRNDFNPTQDSDPSQKGESGRNKWPDLAGLTNLLGSSPVSPVELQMMATSQSQVLPEGKTDGSFGPVAVRGSSKEALPTSPATSVKDWNEDQKDFEKSKTGDVPQQQGMSGVVTYSGGSASGSAKASGSAFRAGGESESTVNSGFYSASGSLPRFSASRFGTPKLSVSQLRQKLVAHSRLRTPAQLRMKAGIGNPHGDLFEKIKFRYNRLSSTLKP